MFSTSDGGRRGEDGASMTARPLPVLGTRTWTMMMGDDVNRLLEINTDLVNENGALRRERQAMVEVLTAGAMNLGGVAAWLMDQADRVDEFAKTLEHRAGRMRLDAVRARELAGVLNSWIRMATSPSLVRRGSDLPPKGPSGA
jgi:hypothetical protein